MKKVLAMILAIFMLVSVLCVGTSADTAPAFVVDSVSAAAGQQVSVAIRAQNNPGICGMQVMLGYDASVLTPVAQVAQTFGKAEASFGPLTQNPMSILWYDAINPDVTTDGTIAVITFQVAEDAPVGEYPLTLSIEDPDSIFASGDAPGSFNVVAFETIGGVLTVVDFTYGDVNNDGKINVRDLGVLQQFINGWGVELIEAAADVNNDGKTNVRDLGLLQQYINGWDVTLGGGTTPPPVDPPVDPNPGQPDEPVEPDDYEPIVVDGVIQNPKAGVAYKLGLNQTTKGAIYYFIGTMSTYYGATDTSIDNAVDMYLEDANGGYKLYFNDANGAKQYIKLVQSGTHYNFTFGAEGSVFTLDAEKNALCAPCGDQICYMGTYGNYVTVGTLTTAKLKDTDYLARLYVTEGGDIGGGDQPVDPNPPVDPTPDPEPPVAGGVTIDFTDKANRAEYSSSKQVWTQNGITVTNEKGASTSNVGDYANPARFYKSSTVTIEYPGMQQIVIDSVTYDDNDYAAPWAVIEDSNVTASVADGNVTITFTNPVDSFTWEKMSAQGRAYSITIYGEGDVGDVGGGDIGGGDIGGGDIGGGNGDDSGSGSGSITPPVDPTPDVPGMDGWTVATTLKDGTAYKLGLNQTAKGAVYYFTGVMSTYYGATDTAVDNAVDMFVETVDGGYKLYFNDANGAKQYIKLEQSGTHYNFTFGAEGSVFTLDADRNALYATAGDQICYMGTYGNYVTVGTLTTAKLKDTDYIARLYISVTTNGGGIGGGIGGDLPVNPNPPVDPTPDVPVEGGVTIDFTDSANRVSYSTEQQVWAQNGITVTNDKAGSSSDVGNYGGEGFPARFYKTSALTIEYAGMTKIVFNCDDYKATYATDLEASITTGTASVDGTVVTVTFDAPVDSLFIEALAAQVRVDSIVVYA